MSKAEGLRKFIIEKLAEKGELSTRQLTDLAIENNVINGRRDSAFRGAIAKLHRDGTVVKRERGIYQLFSSQQIERTSRQDFNQALRTIRKCIDELDEFDWKIEPLSEFCESQDRVHELKVLYERIRIFLDDTQGKRVEHKDEIAMMAGLYQLKNEMEKEKQQKEGERLISELEDFGVDLDIVD